MVSPRQSLIDKTRLSKSLLVAGLQCKKRLWFQVHEPEGDDSQHPPLPAFARGKRIGAAAREFLGDGAFIDLPYFEIEERVAATQAAMLGKAPYIYEASFLADGEFVSADALERREDGCGLIEVKGTLDVKPEHIVDAAVQLYVLDRAGIDVKRVEVMHLNRECRHPDLSNLFVRNDVTPLARNAALTVQELIEACVLALRGSLPVVAVGDHCSSPYKCAFMDRCWPKLPQHHVSDLYFIAKKKVRALIQSGVERIHDLPADFGAKGVARRQIDSVRSGRLHVEPTLRASLQRIQSPVAYLDFETVQLEVPGWPGCSPLMQVPVQMSCHVDGAGELEHHAWLAEGASDPRESLARALIDACAGAETILCYSAGFEKARIAELIALLPELASKLQRIHDRIEDLLPIVRNNVYHPDFNGSFSLKSVLPALVPGLGYDDLKIAEGASASELLQALLFDAEMPATARAKLRSELLAYCERDTLAMVRVHERLKALAEACS